MASGSYRIRLDPWGPDYDGAIQLDEEQAPAEVVTRGIERDEWEALQPARSRPTRSIAFVDGVRRIEHRLLVEAGERALFGLMGSFAVGAALVNGAAVVAHERVERIVCIGGGLLPDCLDAWLANGGSAIRFEPWTVAENTPVAPVQGLQNAMRQREAELAAALVRDSDIVFLDGPLTFLAGAAVPVVGYVKRLLRTYLPPQEAALLPRLSTGQRTPLFLIRDGDTARYSWYLKIADGRPIQSPLAGVVRLETSSVLPLESARALADASARELPAFASRPERDPRAPQNLYPIGGLEAQLRHLLGDALVIRRAVEARLHEEVCA